MKESSPYSAAIFQSALPDLRGKLREAADMSKINWFRVGGCADLVFKPEDTEDLSYFITYRPESLMLPLGVGSNLLVRDGGIEGVVIRLGRNFAGCEVREDKLIVGAGCLNINAVTVAQASGLGGLEFLSGIPGTIGGALAMNAGAYGIETKDVLVEAEAIDPQGNIHRLTVDNIAYRYRHCGLPQGWIFTQAIFKGIAENPSVIAEHMQQIAREREETQPVHSRTGGSTFKNPPSVKAWRLIDATGCRGLTIGGAMMSEKHCNFMINTGKATAEDLETLGEKVRRRVFEHSGIMLDWEIKRIGRPLANEAQKAVA